MKNQSDTSETGGWCNRVATSYQHRDHSLTSLNCTGYHIDYPLTDALADLFAGRTVVGLGEGAGLYRRKIVGSGKVRTYDAYDGAPNIDRITGGEVS